MLNYNITMFAIASCLGLFFTPPVVGSMWMDWDRRKEYLLKKCLNDIYAQTFFARAFQRRGNYAQRQLRA